MDNAVEEEPTIEVEVGIVEVLEPTIEAVVIIVVVVEWAIAEEVTIVVVVGRVIAEEVSSEVIVAAVVGMEAVVEDVVAYLLVLVNLSICKRSPPQHGRCLLLTKQCSENVNTPMPDKTSHDLENAIVAKPRDLTSKDFPARPGYGTAGKAIILRANYFQLKTASTNKDLYRYNVSVMEKEGKKDKGDRGTSVGLSKPKTRRLMEMILESDLFRGKTWATDYSSIIVTTEKLSLGGAAYKGEIELRDANQPAFPAPQATDSTQIKEARRRRTQKFKIEASGTFDLTQLISYVQSKSPYLQSKDDMIQLLNIIIAKTPNTSTNVYTFAQNKFYPDGHSLMESHDLKGGLRALRGYYSSVRTATNRILVNLNVSSAAFYPPIPLVELIGRYREANHFANPPQQQQLIKLETFLRMLQVSTHYLKALDAEGHVIKGADGRPIVVHKTRTIVGFARTPRCGNAETVSFQYRDPNSPQATESTISVFDYFQNHHGITLQIPKIPVLNVGTISKPSYLPAELATVLPGQAVRRLLSGQQTADMITFAARAPHLNALSISGNGLSMMGLAPNLQADTVVSKNGVLMYSSDLLC